MGKSRRCFWIKIRLLLWVLCWRFYVEESVWMFVCRISTVRIWDYTQDACINVLSGHTAPVRGLMWNTEVPYLLISGSWDYTIRVWDTRDGTCLDTVYDHGADVYVLSAEGLQTCSLNKSSLCWGINGHVLGSAAPC
ncbi:hypothetical protein XENOCAPTIV_001502, partial [Xenoophorus captivus]